MANKSNYNQLHIHLHIISLGMTFPNAIVHLKSICYDYKLPEMASDSPFNNKSALVQVMAWCQTADKP